MGQQLKTGDKIEFLEDVLYDDKESIVEGRAGSIVVDEVFIDDVSDDREACNRIWEGIKSQGLVAKDEDDEETFTIPKGTIGVIDAYVHPTSTIAIGNVKIELLTLSFVFGEKIETDDIPIRVV